LRVIRTFILRLLVDSAEPEALRGDLRPMPEGKAQPFPDEQALLALLHRLASPAQESPPAGEKCIGDHSNPRGGESTAKTNRRERRERRGFL
jgi:hypothetical protein